MKKKLFLACLASIVMSTASAQVDQQANTDIIDTEEDTTQVTTVNDIIAMQQKVSISSDTEKHFDDVWGRTKYRNFTYNSTKLNSEKAVTLGTNEAEELKFKSDWGFSIVLGTNYRLHKPISNIVSIGLDYTWFDLNVNHFKADDDAMYNSGDVIETDNNNTTYYMPWKALDKYEVSYGMMLGPSITVAPFTPLNVKGLDYLKLQVYYHFGYRFSTLFFANDKKKDIQNQGSTSSNPYDENEMDHNFKGEWGTGFYTKFGFNISWKFIGMGYEYSSGSVNYKPYSKDSFGKDKNKFKLNSGRVFLQFRF